MLTLVHDGKGVKLSGLGAVEHTDGLSIEAVPVSDLAVRSGSEKLRFIWVVDDLLEHGGFEEALDSDVLNDIPDDA